MTDAQAVADFLKQHPDFFQQHEDLLLELRLPHQSGQAVSLLERQMKLLRERLSDREKQLESLLDTARHNEALLSRIRRLILSLLECQDLNELASTLAEQLSNTFGTPYSRLVITSPVHDEYMNTSQLIVQSETAIEALIQAFLRKERTYCGPATAEQLELLFERGMLADGSVAIIPLQEGDVNGYLLLGSENPDYFEAEMGTDFAQYVADVIVRLLGWLH